VNYYVKQFLTWLGWKRRLIEPPIGIRINVPRSVMRALRLATQPTLMNHEPLAFLRARYASEDVRDVVVAVGVVPFAHEAYVDGDAGANFDTRWGVAVANYQIRSNAGLLLAHSHGGCGKPAFSSVDRATNVQVMAALSIGVDVAPYGALVLSDEDATAVVAVDGRLHDAKVMILAGRLGGLDLTV
jgi:hypothetical protein